MQSMLFSNKVYEVPVGNKVVVISGLNLITAWNGFLFLGGAVKAKQLLT